METAIGRKYIFIVRNTYYALSITVLTTHGQIKSEEVTVDDVIIASLRTSQSVNTSIEWLISLHLNRDTCIFAVDGHWKYCFKI